MLSLLCLKQESSCVPPRFCTRTHDDDLQLCTFSHIQGYSPPTRHSAIGTVRGSQSTVKARNEQDRRRPKKNESKTESRGLPK